MVKLPTPKRLARGEGAARAERQERRTAARLAARRVPGSGSGYERGDVLVPGIVRVECKSTRHESFRITAEMLEKLERASWGGKEIPVIAVELANGRRACLVLPDWALERLVHAARQIDQDGAA